MKKTLLIFILMLMASTVSAQSSKNTEESRAMTEIYSDKQLEEWMEEAAREFDVDPNFLKAVAYIESRKGRRKYRCGWIGRPVRKKGRIVYPGTYAGPMAIHYYYLDKTGLDISDPRINIWVGAKALAGTGYVQARQEARLRTYNRTCNLAYLKAVRQAKSRFAKGDL